jgi:Protein of unknown function (DUF3987)
VLVGDSAKGRKGESWSKLKPLFLELDRDWGKRVAGGLSSGEGLIYNVRDPRSELKHRREKGALVSQDVMVDRGETDKRLFVVEAEFAGALKAMARDGNILSAIIRQAWDGDDLHPLTKDSPLRATAPHISILAHITPIELKKYLYETEYTNGFGNRFLWICTRRSKKLPNPQRVAEQIRVDLLSSLRRAFLNAQENVTLATRSAEAEEFWTDTTMISPGRDPV